MSPFLPTDELYSILQAELKRINFQFFDQLEMNLKEKDVNGTGMLSKDVLRINLVSGFGAAKSQLRSNYINHVVKMLMNRCVKSIFLKRKEQKSELHEIC